MYVTLVLHGTHFCLIIFCISSSITFTAVLSQRDGVFVYARSREYQFSWAMLNAPFSCPDLWTWLHLINTLRYFKILYFYQSRSYTLAKVNITFALLHRTNLHRNSEMISENSFIEGFNSTSSSKSMTASRMYASLSYFSLKRRHSSWAEHQITKFCAWHKTHKKDFNYLWMQVCYSSKSIPEYQFRPLAPRSWSPAV